MVELRFLRRVKSKIYSRKENNQGEQKNADNLFNQIYDLVSDEFSLRIFQYLSKKKK
jgi:hypothetical protein